MYNLYQNEKKNINLIILKKNMASTLISHLTLEREQLTLHSIG